MQLFDPQTPSPIPPSLLPRPQHKVVPTLSSPACRCKLNLFLMCFKPVPAAPMPSTNSCMQALQWPLSESVYKGEEFIKGASTPRDIQPKPSTHLFCPGVKQPWPFAVFNKLYKPEKQSKTYYLKSVRWSQYRWTGSLPGKTQGNRPAPNLPTITTVLLRLAKK